MAPTRTIESTRRMAVMHNRIAKARRYVQAIRASLPDVSREELLWGAAALNEHDWDRMAIDIGERSPSQVTQGVILGMLAGADDDDT